MRTAAALRYSHHRSRFSSLANGPFNMMRLPVPASAFSLGIAKCTNTIRAEGCVTNSQIAAGWF